MTVPLSVLENLLKVKSDAEVLRLFTTVELGRLVG